MRRLPGRVLVVGSILAALATLAACSGGGAPTEVNPVTTPPPVADYTGPAPANADVQNGDILVTSGLDGVFLPGLPVARVTHIERGTSYSFARIFCEPIAGVENHGEILVIEARTPVALPAELTAPAATPSGKSSGVAKGAVKQKRPRKE